MPRPRRRLLLQSVLLSALSGAALAAMDQDLKAPPKNVAPMPSDVYNFDRDIPGKAPAHFTFTAAGSGSDIFWDVEQDRTAPSPPNILAQSGKSENADNFAAALLDGRMLQNGEVAVQFKVVRGDGSQTAGLVWRYKDPQTYYAVVADAQEESCSVFLFKKGKRKLVDTKSAIVTPYLWHELRLVFVNANFSAFIDKELVVGGKDFNLRKAGQVGLWTQGDSVIDFDDFSVSR